jgi:hypothetical protein
MGACVLAVAQGVANESNAVLGSKDQIGSQLITALSAINLVLNFLKLQEAYSKILSEDAQKIFLANLNVLGNPAGAAAVAAATEKRNIDSTQSDRATGMIDNLVQGQKAMAQMEGSTLNGVFMILDPMAELLSTLVHGLQGFLKH